ncbi:MULTISPECIES: acyl carrier protein [Mycobacteriaceae]|jgi:acyl carrier protein|uniref:Acyl carrier protein n=1 Tax=Mycolicibacterium fluoranthenivorans TaxID=258505 RepID=A0A7X5U3V7_9MYCO|nr:MULTISPECIES: acyl carrier protein [Mycobacteriaceae]MCV7254002.1 acyl carrier protein [Mycobacterium hackensackense]MCV7356203.1 acyl carrier protein [Mycolicibacterium fluoranthenivorans]NIH97879.1 acyl carrier protein [Mycolicibacterium fluoranthenivorans]
MEYSSATLDSVTAVIVSTLGIQDRADTLTASTPLFGGMPELDSMAVVALAVALEREFGFEIDDEDFRGEVFETIGTLAGFVEEQARNPAQLPSAGAR